MGILDKLLDEIKSNKLDEQVMELCDLIRIEEHENIKHHIHLPKGPNVFLALEVPASRKNEIAFVCLEREFKEQYVITLWGGYMPKVMKDGILKKLKVWEIKEVKANKILTEYAKIIKYMKGE